MSSKVLFGCSFITFHTESFMMAAMGEFPVALWHLVALPEGSLRHVAHRR